MRKSLVALAILVGSSAYADEVTYKRPAQAAANFVEAPPIPFPLLGPDRTNLVMVTPLAFPSITEVSETELRLAGLRITPRNRATARRAFAQRLELFDIKAKDARARPITGLPNGGRIADLNWSPDGARLAFTVTETDAIRLWVVEVRDAAAHQLATPPLSGVAGSPCAWLSDSRTLACRTVPRDVKPPPTAPTVPTGPIVQENLGTRKPAVTNPDLLTSPTDERLLEYYMASQIALVGIDGRVMPIGAPALYVESRPSPDGKLLLVETISRPFS